MQGENERLTKSAFAARQGWSPSYVTKLKDQGRLVFCAGSDKLIDVEATLEKLKNTSDPGKESIRQLHAESRVERHVGNHISPRAGDDEAATSSTADPKYWASKARREDTLADLAELELARKQGELVERSRVEAVAYAAGRTLRDAMLGLPTQLAPELSTMTDAFAIEAKLRDAIRQVFSDAAKMSVDDLDKAMEPSH